MSEAVPLRGQFVVAILLFSSSSSAAATIAVNLIVHPQRIALRRAQTSRGTGLVSSIHTLCNNRIMHSRNLCTISSSLGQGALSLLTPPP